LHAFLGCDTTSRLYGIGKGQALKKFEDLREHAMVFSDVTSSKEQIATAGEKALVCLYHGNQDDSLNSLRHKRFCEKVTSSNTHIQPQSLPPTSAAAKFHSYRVFLQIQECHHMNGAGLRTMDSCSQ
jgi:hypothetical protein